MNQESSPVRARRKSSVIVVCEHKHEISPLCGIFLAFTPQRGFPYLRGQFGDRSGIVRCMSNSAYKDEFVFPGEEVKGTAMPLIDGVLPRKAVTVLSGPTGIGKSTVALDWAGHISNDEDWYDHTVDDWYNDDPYSVIYITGQDWDNLGRRLRVWEKNHDGMTVDYLGFVDGATAGVDMSEQGMGACLVEELKNLDPDLVIFDSFSTLTNSKLTNDEEEVAKVFARARNLVRELDTAVLFVHHDNSLSEYADAVVTVNKDSDNPGYFYLSTKEEDGGKSFDMEPLRINGFKNNSSGVLLREDAVVYTEAVSIEDDAFTGDTLSSRVREMLT